MSEEMKLQADEGNTTIERVKYNKAGHVLINFERKWKDNRVTGYLSSDQPPPEKFIKLWSGLKEDLNILSEEGLSETDIITDLRVTGVSISYKDGIMGVVVTGLKSLNYSKSPMLINTPIRYAEPLSEKDSTDQCLSKGTAGRMQRLVEISLDILNGERGQIEIPEEAKMRGNIKGLGGIKCDLIAESGELVQEVKSDKNGDWEFDRPDPGVYEIRFRGDGVDQSDWIGKHSVDEEGEIKD